MTPRLARALIALAVPVLTVTALTAPASAAPKGPAIPTIDEVAEIYPHLEGGDADVEVSKVPRLEEDCSEGKPYAGSKARFGVYTIAEIVDMESALLPTVMTGALSFRSVRDASGFLADYRDLATTCGLFGEELPKTTSKKIRFKAGDESFGMTRTSKIAGRKFVTHELFARDGKILTMTLVVGGGAKSPVKKAVRAARLTLETAS